MNQYIELTPHDFQPQKSKYAKIVTCAIGIILFITLCYLCMSFTLSTIVGLYMRALGA